jgi:hypothetical protein
MNFSTPSQWLSLFLKQRNLTSITREPLYTYQVSQDEYDTLKTVVTTFKPKTNINNFKHKDWAACFVLWCSEWYRREYKSQKWTWHDIWFELGFTLEPNQRTDIIVCGLDLYWKRPIRQYTHGRNILGSVFIEGGLPFQLISSKDNKFGGALKKILKGISIANLLGNSTEKLVRHYVDILPKIFSEEESISLIITMTEKLFYLVDTFSLEDKSNPAEYLDSVFSSWREEFPIPLDAEIGTGILNTWLKDASGEGKSRKELKQRLIIEHFLNVTQFSLSTKLVLPQSINVKSSELQLKSNRVELALCEGNRELAHIGAAYVNTKNDTSIISIRNRAFKVIRVSPSTQLDVVILQSGRELKRWGIDKSSIELGEIPVGFEKRGHEYRFVGQATFSCKNADLYLTLPNTMKHDVIEGTCNEWPVVTNDKSITFLKLNGQLLVSTQEDDRYRINTAVSCAAENGLALFGNLVPWSSEPGATFIGIPKYRWSEITENNHLEKLHTYIGKNKKEDVNSTEIYGRQTLSIKNQLGETLLKKRIGILPDDVSIVTVASDTLGEGEIHINTKANMLYHIENEGVSFKKQQTTLGTLLILSCSGLPPSNVTMSIIPNMLSLPIKLTIPYPRKGAFAFDSNGDPLKGKLSVDELLGCRLHLFSAADRSENYEIDIALVGNNRTPPHYKHKYKVSTESLVISLHSFKDQIKELLSLEPELDAKVCLTITSLSSKDVFMVYRYSSRVYTNNITNSIKISAIGHGHIKNSSPVLMQLCNPERKPVALRSMYSEGIETGDFEIPDVNFNEGPWMIVPSNDNNVNFRSRLLLNFNDQNNDIAEEHLEEKISTLHKAVQAFHPRNNTKAIANIIDDMVLDLNHSGWLYLKTLYDNFSHIPLSTFQVWKDLVNNPNALVISLFRFEANAQFIERIESEFPILWHSLSPAIFIQSFKSVSQWLINQNIPSDAVIKHTHRWFKLIFEQLPCYSPELISYLKTEKVSNTMMLPEVIMNSAIEGWFQDLRREHCENFDWPDDHKIELENWYHAQTYINSNMTTFNKDQNSVVYLPVFLAAVAANKVKINDIFEESSKSSFAMKKIRDFDQNWFSSIYAYHLFKFSALI